MLEEIAVIGLIVFLITKELADASDSPFLRRLGRTLNVSITPLAIVFAIIVVMRVNSLL
ncbi:MAG: hypothetical protein PHV74_02935 [Dehalococcoidia bacterium]|nr:hypothetical protein [Dehalococcoidia bacterium]